MRRPPGMAAFASPSDPPRASFELREEDLEALKALNVNGQQSSSRGQQSGSAQAEEVRAFEEWRVRLCSRYAYINALSEPSISTQKRHPCALDHFSQLTSSLKGKRLAIFLDYDGEVSLSPCTHVSRHLTPHRHAEHQAH